MHGAQSHGAQVKLLSWHVCATPSPQALLAGLVTQGQQPVGAHETVTPPGQIVPGGSVLAAALAALGLTIITPKITGGA